MNEEEREDMMKGMKAVFEALYALSFVNPIILAIRRLERQHVLPAEEAFPEIFNNPKVRPYFSLFLSGDEEGNLRLTSFGKALKNFSDSVHHFLADDDLVARTNEIFEIELSNPVRDFVHSAVDTTDRIGKICLRAATALRIITSPSDITTKFDVDLSEKEFREKAWELNNLLLSEYADRISIPELFRPYVIEATSNLEKEEKG